MDFLIKCQNVFLGLVGGSNEDEASGDVKASDGEASASDDDVDGMPMEAAAAAAAAAAGKFKKVPLVGIA